jgi:ribosomal protein S18 acetylase RimI-like enzyme
VAVWGGRRGEGIGTSLIEALEKRAADAGLERMSLSVEAANPAVQLYERLGYYLVVDDDDDLLMLKSLS